MNVRLKIAKKNMENEFRARNFFVIPFRTKGMQSSKTHRGLPKSSAQTNGPPESPSQASMPVLFKNPAQNIVFMISSP